MNKTINISKKIFFGLFVLISFSFLVGCGDKKVEMSFEDTYYKFVNGLFDEKTSINSIIKNDYVNELFDIKLLSNNSDFKLKSEILSKGESKISTSDSDTNISFLFDVNDKIKKTNTNISGGLNVINNTGGIFVKINGFDLTGNGNSELNLIKLMIGSFMNNWIKLDNKEIFGDIKSMQSSDITSTYNIPSKIIKILNKKHIFEEVEKTVYNKKTAYIIKKDNENIKYLLEELSKEKVFEKYFQNIVVENKSLDDLINSIDTKLLFVVESKDEISLIIEELSFISDDTVLLTGFISNNKGKINVKNLLLEEKLSMSRSQKRKYYIFDFDFVNFENIPFNIHLEILPKILENRINYLFEGYLNMSIPQLSLGNESNNIKLDIKGSYILEKGLKRVFQEPIDYMLFSQLLGDPYSNTSDITDMSDITDITDMSSLNGEEIFIAE